MYLSRLDWLNEMCFALHGVITRRSIPYCWYTQARCNSAWCRMRELAIFLEGISGNVFKTERERERERERALKLGSGFSPQDLLPISGLRKERERQREREREREREP